MVLKWTLFLDSHYGVQPLSETEKNRNNEGPCESTATALAPHFRTKADHSQARLPR